MLVKKTLILIMMFFLSFTLYSAPFGDIGVRFGHASFVDFKEKNSLEMNVMTGLSFGLTKHVELDLSCLTPVMPKPFRTLTGGFEIGFSFLGERTSDYDNVMGSFLNSVIKLGFFVSTDGQMLISLRISPITLGSPMKGRRESFMPVGIFYNIKKQTLGLYFSFGEFDYYIRGSWRDLK